MTIDELRARAEPLAANLHALAVEAMEDDFAPWVVEALEQGAWWGCVSPEALGAANLRLNDVTA